LAGSDWVSTQIVPQSVFGAAHGALQTAATHDCPVAQGLPQAPQFAGSAEVSVSQAPPSPQVPKPGRQAQAPDAQSLLGKQELPQPPQFEGSTLVSTHDPPQ
jgi:hypothetical protein